MSFLASAKRIATKEIPSIRITVLFPSIQYMRNEGRKELSNGAGLPACRRASARRGPATHTKRRAESMAPDDLRCAVRASRLLLRGLCSHAPQNTALVKREPG